MTPNISCALIIPSWHKLVPLIKNDKSCQESLATKYQIIPHERGNSLCRFIDGRHGWSSYPGAMATGGRSLCASIHVIGCWQVFWGCMCRSAWCCVWINVLHVCVCAKTTETSNAWISYHRHLLLTFYPVQTLNLVMKSHLSDRFGFVSVHHFIVIKHRIFIT